MVVSPNLIKGGNEEAPRWGDPAEGFQTPLSHAAFPRRVLFSQPDTTWSLRRSEYSVHWACPSPLPITPCVRPPFPPNPASSVPSHLSLSSDLPSGYSYLWFFALVGSGRPSPQFQLLPTRQSPHGPGRDPDIHMAGKAPSQAIERG